MNKAYLLIGGNMGSRLQNLGLAEELIRIRLGNIVQRSSVYETAAWGKTDQQPFLNQALLLHTELEAPELMRRILRIELEMGRERMEKNGPRIIDIDILFFNDLVLDTPQLRLPHPALQLRRFVLVPMAEIAPHLVHPVLHGTITELLEHCPDQLAVQKLEDTSPD